MRKKETRDIVLVVDDSPETLRMLTDAIEEAGMTVLVARESEYALSIIERVVPDVILMDALMPGTDGFQTCRRLKQNKALAHVPVIFMTGLSDTEHIIQGLEAGGVDYVTKPPGTGRAPGSHPGSSRQRAHLAKRSHGARRLWPISPGGKPHGQDSLVHAASGKAARKGVQEFRHGGICAAAQRAGVAAAMHRGSRLFDAGVDRPQG
jgi:CheY-like chemotaxis protein